ncbi:hypothetical protein ACWCWD_22565 [Streptomyces sp. NPDC001493]
MTKNNLTASTRKNLGEAIGGISSTVVLVRVFPERQASAHLFEPDFYRVFLDRETEEGVARLIRQTFGGVADWRLTHDLYLPTTELYLTPAPYQNGYVPEDDKSFGLAPERRIAILNGICE